MTADTAHNELVEKGWTALPAEYRIPALDLDLFSRDGLEILNAVEQQDYNVLRARPSISKGRKIALMVCILRGKFRGRSAA
jgi:hypothetical protein